MREMHGKFRASLVGAFAVVFLVFEIFIISKSLEYTSPTTECIYVYYDLSFAEKYISDDSPYKYSNSTVLVSKSEFSTSPEDIISLPILRHSKATDLQFLPRTTYYHEYEDQRLFKPKVHKTCPDYDIFKYNANEELLLNCKPHSSPKAYETPINVVEKLGKVNTDFSVKDLPPTYAFQNHSEYIYAECQAKKGDIVLRNVYRKEFAKAANETTAKMIKKYSNVNGFKPLTVVAFIIDSTSRQSFFRNLKKTVEFFNEKIVKKDSKFSSFAIYDFLMTHSIHMYTIENMVPVWLGQSHSKMKQKLDGVNLESNIFVEVQKEHALWEHYKNQGFVTMFLKEDYSDNKYIGRNVRADHRVCNFWNLANKKFQFFDKDGEFCIGKLLPTQHSLKYLSEFLKNYKGTNRFAYFHSTAAHEDSGIRIRNIDEDLTKFLEKTLSFYQSINEDIVIVMMADHGKAGKNFVSTEGLFERFNPFTFVIANKSYLSKHGFHKNLQINTQRLHSRYDWHKSFKHLALTPYRVVRPDDNEMLKINTEFKSISVFSQEVPFDRECKDCGIDSTYCLTKNWFDVEKKDWKTDKTIENLIETSILLMNSKLEKSVSLKCNKVIFAEIVRVQKFQLITSDETKGIHYLIAFKIKENTKADFLVHGTSGQVKPDISINDFISFKKIGNIHQVVWSISRLDNSDQHSINLDHCEDSTYYRFNSFLTEGNKTCDIVCNEKELVCVLPQYKELFADYWSEGILKVNYQGRENSIEISETQVIVGAADMCSHTYHGTTGVCSCMS